MEWRAVEWSGADATEVWGEAVGAPKQQRAPNRDYNDSAAASTQCVRNKQGELFVVFKLVCLANDEGKHAAKRVLAAI